jgi:hypothetical protein
MIGRSDAGTRSRRGSHTSRCVTTLVDANALWAEWEVCALAETAYRSHSCHRRCDIAPRVKADGAGEQSLATSSDWRRSPRPGLSLAGG